MQNFMFIGALVSEFCFFKKEQQMKKKNTANLSFTPCVTSKHLERHIGKSQDWITGHIMCYIMCM